MGKNKRTFSTMAEKDMISDLIHDHWVALLSSEELRGRSSCDKLDYFRKVSIVFPGAGVPEGRQDSQVIGVNFQTQRRWSWMSGAFAAPGCLSLCAAGAHPQTRSF